MTQKNWLKKLTRTHIGFTIFMLALFYLIIVKPSNPINSTYSTIPAVVTILLAFATQKVIPSLLGGVFLGSLLASNYSLGHSFLHSSSLIVSQILGDLDKLSFSTLNWYHIKIILFAFALGGLIEICGINGGTKGIVSFFDRFSKSKVSAQLSAFGMGVVIFFDDYANTLIVGNTMRPIADRMKISREKLAWIVDSTAAPVATIAPVSTWIGFELGLFQEAMQRFDIFSKTNAYSLFLNSLPYAFYAIFSLIFILIIVLSKRDFGPMLEFEKKRQNLSDEELYPTVNSTNHDLTSMDNQKAFILNALLPILSVIVLTLACLYFTGSKIKGSTAFWDTVARGDSGTSLMVSSYFGCTLAILMGYFRQGTSIFKSLKTWIIGGKEMIMPTLILLLSWSLGHICEVLKTGVFVSSLVELHLWIGLIPILIFLVSALIAFSTGTSWGCMTLMVPMVFSLTSLHSPENAYLFLASLSAILGGASYGDHCSPISDTTILSSLSCRIEHINHVKTQLPYASTVASVCVLTYLFLSITKLPVTIGLCFGISLLMLIVFIFGKKLPQIETQISN
ncbi:MAG: hypothetical protein KC646_10550 [Candidatus Cloacimonetes bacterium]|nr:hypothetical protein [Candidatus Cloacimonadota bacterium]